MRPENLPPMFPKPSGHQRDWPRVLCQQLIAKVFLRAREKTFKWSVELYNLAGWLWGWGEGEERAVEWSPQWKINLLPVSRPKAQWLKRWLVSMVEEHGFSIANIHKYSLNPSPLGTVTIYQETKQKVHWEKGNARHFWGMLNAGGELTLSQQSRIPL